MSSDYHQYIYDTKNRKLINDFEGAYKNCRDVWPSQYCTESAFYRTIYGIIQDRQRPFRVLDIGCGYGYFVNFLRERGFDAVGIDISRTAIEKGLQRFGDHGQLKTEDICNGLSYNDSAFDSVLLLGVLWFLLEKRDFCLREIQRVLRTDSLFFTSLHIPENPIGKEIIGSYEDFISFIRKYFQVIEAVKFYQRDAVARGDALSDCITDMLLVCKKT
ncbi:MAG: class I SAM-dependent methyltransferase [Candidatus Aureabacteria bacterium]|nr:class I SAM-dependent methyltransferase [Candidatus Auribacterota bacterium]